MDEPLGPSIASDTSTLFQTDAAHENAERRSQLAKLELGSPVTVPCKILCMQQTDESTAWVGCSNFTARKVNLKTGNTTKLFKGHSGPVTAVAVYRGAKTYLMTGSWDKTLRRWDADTKDVLTRYIGHSDFVRTISLDPPYLYSGSTDRTLRKWRLEDGVCEQVFEGHTRGVEATFILDGLLYSASSDLSIRAWDVTTGQCIHTFDGHLTTVYAIVPGVDGDFWSGSADKTIRHWDVETRKCEGEGEMEHPDFVKCILPSADGRYLFTGCRDECVRVWDVASGRCIALFEGHFDEISGLSAMGSTLISASLDGSIRRWSISDADLQKASTTKGEAVKKAALAKPKAKTDSGMTEEEERELAELMGSDDD